jgi:hypothetical protein
LAEAILSVLRAGGPPTTPELARFGPPWVCWVPAWAEGDGDRPAEPSVILLGEALLALLRSVAGASAAQIALASDNIEAVLRQAGMTLANVVRLNIYTVDVDAFCEHYGVLLEATAVA